MLIADNVGMFADTVFTSVDTWPSSVIWVATLCFSVQIYCDFSGYSDIAIGVARVLGFHLPINFNRPYFATSPAEFWHRWHISLSTWLRDYLYIPLGGNRYGFGHTCRNLMITMMLGGLWHGASWNFVLWGFLHGIALVIHRFWRIYVPLATTPVSGFAKVLKTLICWVAVQYWVLFTWLTFRLTDTASLLVAVKKFLLFDFNFRLSNIGIGKLAPFSTALIIGAFLVIHAWSNGEAVWTSAFPGRVSGRPLPFVSSPAYASSYCGRLPTRPLSTSSFNYRVRRENTSGP